MLKSALHRWWPQSIFVGIMFLGSSSGVAEDLRNTTHQADYLVVAPTAYLPLAEQLAAFRHATDSYTTLVAPFDTILTQFGGGIPADSALKSFIQYALKNWQKPAPKHIVLAGNINTIPSHHEKETILVDTVRYDSLWIDHWFVEGTPDAWGYGAAQAALGRLPAWDSVGLAVMIQKVIAIEEANPADWFGRCLGLADGDSLDGSIFEMDLRGWQKTLVSVWTDTITVHMRGSSPEYRSSAGFSEIWSEGAAIALYCGHANPFVFSASEYFTTASVDSLTNADRLPVCFFEGCNLSFWPHNPSSIPAHLLERPGGGAVACISAVGYAYEAIMSSTYSTLFTYLVTNPNATVGEALVATKNTLPGDNSRLLTLLGDPAQRLRRPATIAAVTVEPSLPTSCALFQNYPNPCNPLTHISFAVGVASRQLPVTSHVRIVVFDMLGREVAVLVDEDKAPGMYEVKFDGANLASGVYICRMQAGNFVESRKIMLLK